MSKANPFGHLAAQASTDDTPVEVRIEDRDGNPYLGKGGNPIVFQVVGEYSKAYRAGEKAIMNKTMKRARAGADFDADDAEEQTHERIAYGVVGWNAEDGDGTPVPFSRANVVAFLEMAPWAAKKIDAVIRGHSSFFKRASTS